MKESKLGSQKDSLVNFIKVNIKNSIIKNTLLDAFNDKFEEVIVNIKYSRDRLVLLIGWYILAYQLRDIDIRNISWELICNLYNTDYYLMLCEVEKLFNEESELRVVRWIKSRIQERRAIDGYFPYKNDVLKFYTCISDKGELFKYENIKEIQRYRKYLINDYAVKFDNIDDKLRFDDLHKYTLNNLPVNSEYNHLIQKEYVLVKHNTINKVNFNCRTEDRFIKYLLMNFIDKIYDHDKAPHNRILRVFIYYFLESLNGKQIKSYKDFDYELLKTQYQFYIKLVSKYDIKDKDLDTTSFSLLIIQFYRLIISTEDTSFSDLEQYIIKCKVIHRLLRENYELILLNPNENIPNVNKFCVVKSEYTMKNAAQSSKNYFVDLIGVDKTIQQDIKEFLWYSNESIDHRFSAINIILYFLDFKEQYYKFYYRDKSNYENFKYLIDENMLYMYVDKINEEYSNNNTKKSIISQVRHYLKFHKDKYNLKESSLEIISLKGLYEYSGGNPITDNDLKIIYKEVKELAEANKSLRIYAIAFEISLLSNLRLGEILALERNCIINDNTIRYISKVSEKNYKEQTVNKDIINLIREAISLTEDVLDDSYLSKYIFIEGSSTNYSYRIKKIEFYLYFKRILNNLKGKLENDNYRPYNLRHTFIDKVYKEGVKNNLSLAKIATIAGNSFDTAKRHYRKWDDYKMYVETLAKVKLTDSVIRGEVLPKESKILKPVKENLGACKDDNCTFDLAECLMCKHFITFTSRIDVFENRIKKINADLENCEEAMERENLICEKKLLSKYLIEMFKIKGGEIENAN